MSKIEEYKQRYNKACHAMQSGVAMMLNYPAGRNAATPKHLRVGINSALSETGALATLLLAKGVFSEEEYFEALTIAMEAEVERYKEEINATVGGQVTLA